MYNNKHHQFFTQGSSQREVKRAYHKLSLILHPDKETGNEKAFMKLTKGKYNKSQIVLCQISIRLIWHFYSLQGFNRRRG